MSWVLTVREGYFSCLAVWVVGVFLGFFLFRLRGLGGVFL